MRIIFLPICVWILDRVTKVWILTELEVGQSIELFSYPPVAITHHLNTGIAFCLLPQYQSVILLVNCVIITFVTIFYIQVSRESMWKVESLGSALILGGALGNLFDRFKYQAVIDFIDFRVWPVFNLADSFICIGATIMIIDSVYRMLNRRVT